MRLHLHDFKIFKELFDYDFQNLGEEYLEKTDLPMIRDYKGVNGQWTGLQSRESGTVSVTLQRHLMERNDAEEFKEKVTQFYKEFGVGKLGLHKAFRIEHTEEGVKNRADHKDCSCAPG